MSRYSYHRPASLDAALKLMQELPGARFVAGGTDLMVRIKNRDLAPKALISLRGISGLAGIQLDGPATIGAMTTIAELIDHPGLGERYPGLIQAARRLGSAQIRNAATIGGNLCNCSPCADTATPLLTLGARVRLRSPEGERELPLEDFFVGPGQTCAPPEEILVGIQLPEPVPGAKAFFFKKGRVRMDLALASLSALLVLDGQTCKTARLAAGSVASTALRLTEAETVIENQTLSAELATRASEAAAAQVMPISDLRASADYRRRLVRVYVERAITQAMNGSQA
jgi:CO/xanthine dehydrogenase FAD-binding subunit